MANEQMNLPTFNDSDKREASFHDFKEKAEVVGKLVAIEEGSFGKQYTIDTPDGDVIVGSYDVLKGKIHDEDKGKWIKIVCTGDVVSPKSKRTYKDFEVFIK